MDAPEEREANAKVNAPEEHKTNAEANAAEEQEANAGTNAADPREKESKKETASHVTAALHGAFGGLKGKEHQLLYRGVGGGDGASAQYGPPDPADLL